VTTLSLLTDDLRAPISNHEIHLDELNAQLPKVKKFQFPGREYTIADYKELLQLNKRDIYTQWEW